MYWSIAQGGNTWLSGKGCGKGGFGRWLVYTGEYLSCIMTFKLSHKQLFIFTLVLKVAGVQTLHRISNSARSGNCYCMLTGCKFCRGCKCKLVIFALGPGSRCTIDCGAFHG